MANADEELGLLPESAYDASVEIVSELTEGEQFATLLEDLEHLSAGCQVEVNGLKGAPQHNGKRGKVVRFDASKDRCHVQLSHASQRRPGLF